MKKNQVLEFCMAVVLLFGAWYLSKEGAILAGNMKSTGLEKQKVVVLDSGHGGSDPGKVGVNKILEKDINLSIAKKLKVYLESEGVKIIMTREEDKGLYEEGSSNKKAQDMKNRCKLIEESDADLTVSIHQNSYHEEYVKGAQVFYFSQSQDGKELAEFIQEALLKGVDPSNKRMAKGNDSYYLLKNTKKPTVIVECGFLSNWEEAQLLALDDYQEKLAWNIYLGIMKYINKK